MVNRFAIKIAYIGKNYQGFQRQEKSINTIEGVIINALIELGIILDASSARYSSAGRTDRGVSALSQTISLNSLKEQIHLEELNQKLPDDIFAWSIARVDDSFHARKSAIMRTYKYFYPYNNENLCLMKRGLKKLKGQHDFIKLSKKSEDFHNDHERRTILDLQVSKVKLNRKQKMLEFEFSSRSFLWHQVRKMVYLILGIGSEKFPLEIIHDVLNPLSAAPKEGIVPAPPDGLVLYDIQYDNVVFEPIANSSIIERSLKKKINHYSSTLLLLRIMTKTLLRKNQ